MAQISIQKLSKSYKQKRVLKEISLEMSHGELLALVGPSGCGKTTTLKILAGLIAPDAGKIFIDGQEITQQSPEERDIVMVFQDNLLFPHMTVGENITFGLKMAGKSKAIRTAKLQELLALVQLPGLEKRYPSQLSGGQQQRVALARALALEPGILLLDEPLSNLDPGLRKNMRELIDDIHQNVKTNMVFVTHDQEEAMLLADKIAVMFAGTISQYATPYELYKYPLTPDVANLLGPCNIVPGYINGHIFRGIGLEGHVNASIQGKVDAYIRAEQIQIMGRGEGVPGIIRETQFFGGYSLCELEYGGRVLVVRYNGLLDLPPGTPVGFSIDWQQVHFNPRSSGVVVPLKSEAYISHSEVKTGYAARSSNNEKNYL